MTTETISHPLQNLDLLNQKFANANLKFSQVAQGLIKAVLRFSTHAQAEIHLQGAHLTRWLDSQGRDNIFTSSTAVYQAGVPIRGGNPIIFPQFGPGEMCQHGFARHSLWRVLETEVSAAATTLVLELKPQDIAATYQAQWQHDFVVTLTISLGETLLTQMKVYNPNAYPFTFTHGFHTYLAVDNIAETEITGCSGLEYMDNLRDRAIFCEQREQVEIANFTDRRYQDVPAELGIHDKSSGRLLAMHTQNCRDAFIWNPWQDAARKLADLEPQSYQKFVCVEPGNMKTAVVLAAGHTFISKQEIKRLDSGVNL